MYASQQYIGGLSEGLIIIVRAFYWNKVNNFGDLLTPYLLKRFSRLDTEWSSPQDSQIVVVGSVIDLLPKDYTGIIAGAGKLHEYTTVPSAHILALRGPLTAKGVKGNFALGDPALLADELIKKEERIYNLGVIPHWSDKQLEFDPRFTRYDPKIIRVGDDPIEVIKEISRCKKIVSSSLHGIILADALNIPRRIELAPKMISHPHQEGGLFKWQDYSASLSMPLRIGLTQTPSSLMVSERQHELFDMFREIRKVCL